MISVDGYLSRRFDRRSYDCLAFAREVWMDLKSEDLSLRFAAGDFERLQAPSDPCLVLMRRPRTTPHVGVYLRGKVLHLHEGGAEFQPLANAARAFRTVEFYR